MKRYYLLPVILMFISASCTVTKRHYTGGWHIEWKQRTTAVNERSSHAERIAAEAVQPAQLPETILPALSGYADTLSAEKSQQTAPLKYKSPPAFSHKNEPLSGNLPADTLAKKKRTERNKWVPYKYRHEQLEAERKRNTPPDRIHGPGPIASFFLVGLLIYFGYGTAVGLAAIVLFIADFSFVVQFGAYALAYVLAWAVFAPTTSLILRICFRKLRNGETEAEHRKRLWNYAMIIASILALATVLLFWAVFFI